MIAALVNLAPGVGRTTLAVNLAGELALQGKRVALLDVDGVSGAREWAGMRRRNELPALFDTVTITSAQLRCALWGLGTSVDHVVIDTPARSPAAVRAALLAAETVLVPTPPGRKAVGRCAATMQLVIEALAAEPALAAALVLTRAPEGLLVEPGTEAVVLGLRLPVAGGGGAATAGLRDEPEHRAAGAGAGDGRAGRGRCPPPRLRGLRPGIGPGGGLIGQGGGLLCPGAKTFAPRRAKTGYRTVCPSFGGLL